MDKDAFQLVISVLATKLMTFVGCYFTYKATTYTRELTFLKQKLRQACEDVLTFREIEAAYITLLLQKNPAGSRSYESIKK